MFSQLRLGGRTLARATFQLFFGLFVLLAVGLLSTGRADAVISEQGQYLTGSFNFAQPARVSTQISATKKAVCVHATERSQESCIACSTSFAMNIVSRVRLKATGPGQKTGNPFFLNIQNSFGSALETTRLGAIFGTVPKTGSTSRSIFARTSRLRI